MKAAVCVKYGPPENVSIVDLPKPTPNANQVLVRIKATTVNSADIRIRGLQVEGFLKIVMRLVLGFSGPRKQILGINYTGIVEEIGTAVTKFRVGDRVMVSAGFAFSGHAEYAVISEKAVISHLPDQIPFEDGAAMIFGGMTAYYFLEKYGFAQLKQAKVLIYGASGSVGTAAIQIAKHFGAEVTAVCSGKNIAFVKGLGADHAIDYNTNKFTELSTKFDLVFDAVGKLGSPQVKTLKAPNGKFHTVGGLDTAAETIPQLELLKELYLKGKFNPCIDRTFTLDDIVSAHRYVDTGRKRGNVVVVV